MKFDEFKEGMHVRDHLGNEYCVMELAPDAEYGYKVRLKCTKHVKPVRADYMATFTCEGEAWWIQHDRSKLLNADDTSVRRMLKAMHYSPPYNLPVAFTTVDKAGVEYTFYAWSSAKLEAFELTVDELNPVIKVEPVEAGKAVVSTDSLKLGMKLQHADGMYIVLGFDDQYVHMGAVVDAITCDSVTHKAAMCTQIPVEAPEGQLSLKDFTVAED